MIMKKTINFSLLLLLPLLLLTTSFKNADMARGKIHAILVIDEYSNIKDACKKDYRMMERELKIISNNTRLESVIYKTDFTKRDVNRVIDNLKVKSNDVILFYYTGHGYRYTDQESRFPYLVISKQHQAVQNIHMGLEKIHNRLKKKNARLTVSLADACNALVPIRESDVDALDLEEIPESVYKNLFLDKKGDVIVSSSSATEYSYCNAANGSFYTIAFLNALHEGTTNTEWEDVLGTTKTAVLEMSQQKQRPQYDINVTDANVAAGLDDRW